MPVGRLLREELTRGIAINIVMIGAQSVITILASVIVSRYLGPTGVGIVAIGLLLAEVVSVFDNLASQGFVRDMASGYDEAKVATVLGTKAILGSALTVLLVVISPLIARIFNVPLVVPMTFSFIPAASIISSVALMSWEARRDMARRNVTQIAEAIARLGLYSLVAFAVSVPVSREAAVSFATLAASAFASLVGIAIIPSLSLKKFDRARAKSYVKFGMRSQATGALQKILFWFDIVLIDITLGHHAQGLYKTAYTLVAYIALVTGAVAVMMYPTIAAALSENDNERVRRTFSVGAFFSTLVALPLILVFVAFPRLTLHVLVGPAFDDATWMLRALGALAILPVALVPFEVYFPAIGRPDLGLRVAAVEVISNVVLNLILVPRIGILGAVIATGVSFSLGLIVAVWTFRQLGHEAPRWTDVRSLLERPVPTPPEEPPRL